MLDERPRLLGCFFNRSTGPVPVWGGCWTGGPDRAQN